MTQEQEFICDSVLPYYPQGTLKTSKMRLLFWGKHTQKLPKICLLLKSCSKFLYYKSNRGIRTQSHFSATFPKGTLDSLVSGYLRQKYDLLSRTVEILKLPAFFWISFCKALLLSAGLEKSHEAHSNQSNAIIGLLHWATSKSYPNRHLSCLYTSFPILLLLRLKW